MQDGGGGGGAYFFVIDSQSLFCVDFPNHI